MISSASPSVLRLVRRTVGALAVLALLPALAGVALEVVTHLRGDRLMIVSSGSMAPLFRAGDAILTRPLSPGGPLPGTVVSFRAGGTGTVTTHRVVQVLNRPDGRYIRTKGDANAAPDPDLTSTAGVFAQLDGSLAGAGRWIVWSQSRPGRLLMFGPSLLLLAAAQVCSHLRSEAAPTTDPTKAPRPTKDPRRTKGPGLAGNRR